MDFKRWPPMVVAVVSAFAIAALILVTAVLACISYFGVAVTVANSLGPEKTTEKALLLGLASAHWLPVGIFALAVALTAFLCYQLVLIGRNWPADTSPRPLEPGVDPLQPGPQAINPLESYFSRRAIRIADLVFTGDYVVTDKTFEDCFLYGPAVITFMVNQQQDQNNLSHCTFDGVPDAMMIEIVLPRTVDGVIAFTRCTLRRCTLKRVGILGDAHHLALLRSATGVDEPQRPTGGG